jgi:hypothetical protein
MGGEYSTHEMKRAYKILVGKPEEKSSIHRREGNIKINLKYIGCEFLDWIRLAEPSLSI